MPISLQNYYFFTSDDKLRFNMKSWTALKQNEFLSNFEHSSLVFCEFLQCVCNVEQRLHNKKIIKIKKNIILIRDPRK